MGAFIDLGGSAPSTLSLLQQPHGTLAARSELCSLVGQVLSLLTSVCLFIPRPRLLSTPQVGYSSHDLWCTLCLFSHSVPSTQDGLPVFISLQIRSYSLRLNSRVIFLRAISPKRPYPSWASGFWSASVSSWHGGRQCGVPDQTRIGIQAPSFTSTNHVTLNKMLNFSFPL